MKSEWNVGKQWTFKRFKIAVSSERNKYWGGVNRPTFDKSYPFRWTYFQLNFYISNISVSIRIVTFKEKIL